MARGPRPFKDEVACDLAMLKWLRRQVNADLRYWRHGDHNVTNDRLNDLIADCKAKLGMLDNAENWRTASVRENWPESIDDQMVLQRMLLLGLTRRAFHGYRGRDGWRDEWDYKLR